ncbi:unnamed protein product [Miscanthus lutarioriparius]|uniref:Uncharacterized protein n=1 Tax=Miscanthus lutarioriparius TaxID=422564 RepID=A0A811QEQ6_9POAL|nr:unnamed protein product [Miscanthus lutarioriparius]
MEKMREDANPSVEMVRWNRHSIYRVPQFIKDTTSSEAYSPRFVSLGPLHHGEPHLLPMEDHKRRAVLHMVNRSGKPLQDFVAAIDEVADELQAAYNDLDDDKWRGANKGRFVEMMVMDGCFLLEWARTAGIVIGGNFAVDYATNDPIFSLRSYIKLWGTMKRDMIAMENQLPLIVLQRLLAVQSGEFPKAAEINNMVQLLLDVAPCFEEGIDELGLHFLDIFHKSYCGTPPQWEESDPDEFEPRTPCAVELSEAGIQLKKSRTDSIHDVDFKKGVLSMPLFTLHDDTEIYLLNLMAFERLHPGSNFYVASYISFVDQIIESERDVALLRSQGLFANMIGSDKNVVKMFNTLTKLATTPLRGSKLGYVNWKVNSHCKKRRNRWRASFMNTYLSNPWVFTSMVAAFILLVAALLQTVYTAVPFYTRKG